MKQLGTALLVLGIGVAAAFGSRISPALSPSVEQRFLEQARGAARDEILAMGVPAAQLTESSNSYGADEVRRICEEAARRDREARHDRVEAARECQRLYADFRTLGSQIEDAPPSASPSPRARLARWFGQSGLPFGLGVLLVVIGAVLSRMAIRREARKPASAGEQSETVGDGAFRTGPGRSIFVELKEELEKLRDRMQEKLTAREADARRREVKTRIEDLQLEHYARILEDRPRMIARHSIGHFADFFGPFSASERHVNRAWSALVDGHDEEAALALAAASDDLQDTLNALKD